MPENAIIIENLSKQYRLGLVGTGTLSHDLKRWWTVNVLRGEDPYLKIGERNDRTVKGNSDYVWALKNISFNIKEGEVIGIIGKNGAGKSTLLKILSKVTKPTTGRIIYKGKIASLLEVGTGFHPELTGRENIFMNGAIMGMKKLEIERKLEEIIEFAGITRYIDTPVKRYSSGMTVRLGFSVAAHLEPDILVVDEVLAVGDAEFQKRCLGKMKDASGHGRTVLFVSHNLNAVRSLCPKSILIQDGIIVQEGNTSSVIDYYTNQIENSEFELTWDDGNVPQSDAIVLKKVELQIMGGTDSAKIMVNHCFRILFIFESKLNATGVNLSLFLKTVDGICVFNAYTDQKDISMGNIYQSIIVIPENLLNTGKYVVELYIIKDYSVDLFYKDNLFIFEIHEPQRNISWYGKVPGIVRPPIKFDFF